MLKLCCCLLLTALLYTPGFTQKLQSPDEFLNYPLGSRFTPHHQLVEYFRQVTDVSDKVNLVEYGSTYELRPLIAAIVSSPENLNNLEAIRTNNLRRTGMLEGNISGKDIAIVHLSYSIHGNEAAGSETSMAVIHALAKGGKDIDAWLSNTVVIIDPSLNPDGYSRYTNWNNQVSAKTNDPWSDTREHHEPWPGGRVNHYYFDLNRDWAWLTQKETRDRIKFYLQWMPHIHADLHEMSTSSSYYFAPAAQPYHPYLSGWQAAFQTEIGKNHATYFDKEGWRYFTKEEFDLFYPSYGDTYPMLSGAIGLTYEQGGSGRAGRAYLQANGDTLSLTDRIEHHYTTSLSTIEIASKNAGMLVREFEKYYRTSSDKSDAKTRSYVISQTNNAGRIADLVQLLDGQQIKYAFAAEDGNIIKAQAFDPSDAGDAGTTYKIRKGDLIIPSAQPRSILLHVLFEKEATLADSLTYDITAWSIPMAYGLNTLITNEEINISTTHDQVKNNLSASARPYAYALTWGSVPASNFLASLQTHGIIARYALNEFKVNGVQYPRGTVLCMRADNLRHPDFDNTISTLANQTIVPVTAITTGFVEVGKDLGSDYYPLVRTPQVLTVAGEGVSSQNIGQLWHFFEEELNYPIHIIDHTDLSSVNLSSYNVILLPEGYYILEKVLLDKLKSWARDGGQIVVFGSALNKFSGNGFAITSKNGMKDEIPKEDLAHPESYDSPTRKSITDDIAGAVFRTKLDPTHPLAFGLGDIYYTLKTGSAAYQWLPANGNGIFLDEKPVYYGFTGKKAYQKISKTLVAGREAIGSGGIVYFVDNPMFRSFWNSGKVLFSNALFF